MLKFPLAVNLPSASLISNRTLSSPVPPNPEDHFWPSSVIPGTDRHLFRQS